MVKTAFSNHPGTYIGHMGLNGDPPLLNETIPVLIQVCMSFRRRPQWLKQIFLTSLAVKGAVKGASMSYRRPCTYTGLHATSEELGVYIP